jgi:hypothetical protein
MLGLFKNNELKINGGKVVAYFKALCRHLPGGSDANYEKMDPTLPLITEQVIK